VVQKKKVDKQDRRIEAHDNAWIDDLQNLEINEFDDDEEIEVEGVKSVSASTMRKKIKKNKKEKKSKSQSSAPVVNKKTQSRLYVLRRKKVERKMRKDPQLYSNEMDF
jgi:hypothetical protein